MTDDVAFPWMTAETGATYLDFTGKDRVDAFRVWAKRQGECTTQEARAMYGQRGVDGLGRLAEIVSRTSSPPIR